MNLRKLFISIFHFSSKLAKFRTYAPHTHIKKMGYKEANINMKKDGIELKVFSEITRAFDAICKNGEKGCSVHVRLYEKFEGKPLDIEGTLFQGYLDVRVRSLVNKNEDRATKKSEQGVKKKIKEHFLLASIQNFFPEITKERIIKLEEHYAAAAQEKLKERNLKNGTGLLPKKSYVYNTYYHELLENGKPHIIVNDFKGTDVKVSEKEDFLWGGSSNFAKSKILKSLAIFPISNVIPSKKSCRNKSDYWDDAERKCIGFLVVDSAERNHFIHPSIGFLGNCIASRLFYFYRDGFDFGRDIPVGSGSFGVE